MKSTGPLVNACRTNFAIKTEIKRTEIFELYISHFESFFYFQDTIRLCGKVRECSYTDYLVLQNLFTIKNWNSIIFPVSQLTPLPPSHKFFHVNPQEILKGWAPVTDDLTIVLVCLRKVKIYFHWVHIC